MKIKVVKKATSTQASGYCDVHGGRAAVTAEEIDVMPGAARGLRTMAAVGSR